MKVEVGHCEPSKRYPYAMISPVTPSEFDFPYLCDTTTDGGGWIVINRRYNGKTDFNQNWAAYKNGFGEFDGEFWLGNEKIHTITKTGRWEARIEMRFNFIDRYAAYSTFSVDSEDNNYKITVTGYSGDAGNTLGVYHNGRAFSTFDRDNDGNAGINCALARKSGWWFQTGCEYCNLNGLMGKVHGFDWYNFGGWGSIWTAEMKIRRTDQ